MDAHRVHVHDTAFCLIFSKLWMDATNNQNTWDLYLILMLRLFCEYLEVET